MIPQTLIPATDHRSTSQVEGFLEGIDPQEDALDEYQRDEGASPHWFVRHQMIWHTSGYLV